MQQTMSIADLTHEEQSTLNALWKQLRDKQPRNELRASYYDGKNALRDLGVSMPPACRRLAVVLGWSAKAVDILNDRCVLDGFTTTPGFDLDSVGLGELWDDNMLDVEAPQAGVSSLIHATAFLITHQGDVEAGEPAVLVTAKDGLSGTGQWDPRRRSLRSFLSLIDSDAKGNVTEFVLYLPNLNVSCTKTGKGWVVVRREHSYGVPVDPLVYRPRLARPFGSSRISRAVMSLHDSAIRTALRSEVTAELYSVPQRVLLGADESVFKNEDGSQKPAWQVVFGRLWGIPDDEEALNPRADIKEFTSAPQTPHVDQLRAWAQLFSGETSIPVGSLGLGSTDTNPTSAESYYASREDLIKTAEGTVDGWSPAWRRRVVGALQMLHGWSDDQIPAEVRSLRPKWRNPATPSRAAAADAASKTIDKFPWLAETPLGLELYGFDKDFIDRAMAEQRRLGGSAALRAITEAAREGRTAITGAPAPPQRDPAEVKAQADALGALIRSGVDPVDAARQVGLSDIRFTGAVPVSLRLPESDARTLET